MKTRIFLLFLGFKLCTLFSVAQSNVPKVTIKGLKGGEISIDSLLKADRLEINEPFKILRYKMIHISNGIIREFDVSGNQLISIIRNCKSKDRFIFEEIQAIGNNNMIYKVSAISLLVK